MSVPERLLLRKAAPVDFLLSVIVTTAGRVDVKPLFSALVRDAVELVRGVWVPAIGNVRRLSAKLPLLLG